MTRDREYDRFGPWVLRISDEDPPPRLFLPHLTRTESPLLSLKVPRRITRREAHPGMDLYDYVISLYEDDMVILQRVESDVRAETIRYRDIQHLRTNESLLRGRLHLAMPGSTHDLPYNTVSREVMESAVDIIRARYQRPGRPEPVQVTPVAASDLSFYFEGLLRDERDEGSGMQPVAAQAEISMREHEDKAWRRLLFGIVDKRLLESLHFCDGRELKIVGRGQLYAYRWQSVYGKDVRYIPIANISAVEWVTDAHDAGLTQLSLRTAGGGCTYVFTQDNPTVDAYRGTLERLTRRR